MTHKAQVKMFESIAILIVFFFLLVFGISFYSMLQNSGTAKDKENTVQLKSVTISQKITALPEFDCAITGVQIENCLDVHKIIVMTALLQQEEKKIAYFPVLEYSTIKVYHLYPGEQWTTTVYDHQGDNTRKIPTFYPMVLYNATSKHFDFGVLEVDIYGS